MYNDEVTRPPRDEDDMWDLLREQFEFVRDALWQTPIETKDDALENLHHREKDGSIKRDGIAIIRYRNTGGEIDQRDHFLKMGEGLLPYIHEALDKRELTPEFVQQWGKIMFCHGYIASYIFDDTDDLLAERNRKKGGMATRRTSQHVFLSRLILHFMDHKRQVRKQAEGSAAEAISNFVSNGMFPKAFQKKWFEGLVSQRGEIVSTLRQKHMSDQNLRKLAQTEADAPLIEEIVPQR